MAESEQTVIVGTFEDRNAVLKAMDALIKAGFKEDQLGFVARTSDENIAQAQHHVQHGHGPKAIARGIIGGIIGAADILLVPFIGPADASNILATALPITEEAIDNLPYPGSHADKQPLQRPDDAMRTQQEPVAKTQSGIVSAESQEQARVEDTAARHSEQNEQRASVVTGGVVGGALGAAAAALFLPGIGPIVAGGIIAAALGGGAVGSVAGNFLGTLTDIGIPKEHARQYAQDVKEGRTIITVKDTQRQQEASEILRQQGALDVQIH
ncbi:hypothetical protein [Dictyobacter kobayashii]|uniref:General stress protein 17M-like domain-containing protein n=1 Tax=Dictyobacter kobayashii TaxID=2014872 RepID=A0A402AJN2_9CHLR|nr:hypothetical protein [Dictyobacter kobayashii]GCE19327.1 hypothetical protein KDK_31270 [Dictyobacter kobayashii]